MKPYRILPHTADMKVRVFGKTLRELFFHALLAMFAIAEPIYARKYKKVTRKITVHAPDINALLVDFLNEILYTSDTYDEAYNKVRFSTLTSMHVRGTVIGKTIIGFKEEIKAVTHHGVNIQKNNGAWQTDIVFDV